MLMSPLGSLWGGVEGFFLGGGFLGGTDLGDPESLSYYYYFKSSKVFSNFKHTIAIPKSRCV